MTEVLLGVALVVWLIVRAIEVREMRAAAVELAAARIELQARKALIDEAHGAALAVTEKHAEIDRRVHRVETKLREISPR